MELIKCNQINKIWFNFKIHLTNPYYLMNYRCHSSKEKWTWTERQTDQQIDNIRNTGQWLVEGIQKKIPLKVIIIHVYKNERTATYISLNFGWTNKSWNI